MPAFAPPSADTLVSDQPWSVNESEFNPPPPDSLVKFEPPSANTLQGTVDPSKIALAGDIDKHPEQAPQERPRGIDEWLGEKLSLDKNTIPDALHTIGSFVAAYDPDTATADENPEAKFSRLMELPSRPPTKGEQVAGGLINSMNKMTASMADPVNAALLVTGAVGPAIVARAVSAYFFKHMLDAGPEVWTRAGEISVIGDTQEKTEAYADAGMTFIFTALAGAHAGKAGLANEVPALRDALRKRVETDYTAEEVRDLYQRVQSGKGTPEEQALVMELYNGAKPELDPLRVRKIGERDQTTVGIETKIPETGAVAQWLGLKSAPEIPLVTVKNLVDNGAPETAKALEAINENLRPPDEPLAPTVTLTEPAPISPAPLTAEALKATEPKPAAMGAAARGELPIPPDIPPAGQQPDTSIKNSVIDQQRKDLSLEPIEKVARKGWEQIWDESGAKMQADPALGELKTNDYFTNPRAFENEVDQAIVFRHEIAVRTTYTSVLMDLNEAIVKGDGVRADELRRVRDFLEKQLDVVDKVAKEGGSALGGTLNARKMMIREDMSLGAVTRKLQIAADRPLTELEHAEIAKLHAEMEAKEAAFDEALTAKEIEHAEAAHKLALETLRAEAAEAKVPVISPYIIGIAERIGARLKADADVSRKALAGKFLSPTPKDLLHLANIMADNIYTMGLDFAKISAKMITELGPKVEPYLKDAFDKAQAIIEGNYAKVEPQARKAVKRKVEKTDAKDAAEETASILDAVKAKVEKKGEDALETIGGLARKLALKFIGEEVGKGRKPADITGEEIDAVVHETLKEALPDITPVESRDAWTQYGKYSQLDKDAVKTRYREARTEQQKLSTLERLLGGEPGLKTGGERQPPTNLARRRDKQINELKKSLGIVTTDPATQLRSALQARETYYTNRLADLRSEISKGERLIKTRNETPTSPALEALKAEYATVKAEHEAIFKKPGLTDAQKHALALKTAERNQSEWEIRLANAKKGNFETPPKGFVQRSAQLDAIRARTEAIREEVKLLKDADAGVQSELAARELAEVEARSAELERQINEGNISPKAKTTPKFSTPELDAARAERRELLKIKAKLQAALKSKTPSEIEAKKLAEMDERITALVDKINAGEIDVAKKSGTPISPEMAAKRAELSDLNKVLTKLRAAAKAKTPAEIDAKKIADTEAKIEEVIRQINEGDIGVKPKTPKPTTAELAAKRSELTELNKVKAQLRNAAKPRKTPDQIALQAFKTRTAKKMADQLDRMARGDFSKTPKRPPLDISKDAEAMKLAGEAAAIKTEFERRAEQHKAENFTTAEKLAANFTSAIALSRNVMTAYDISAVGRQGGFIGAGNPIRAVRNLIPMFRALASEKTAQAIHQSILHRPNAGLYVRDKLFLAELDGKLTAGEEATIGAIKLVQKIPGLRASNRAYSTYLNLLRADSYDAMMLKNEGRTGSMSIEDGRAISNFINVATGRGDLGRFESFAQPAASVLFSPRLNVSRVQMAIGQPVFGKTARAASPALRRMIAEEYAKTAIGVSAFIGLAVLAGATIETDPRSSDYAKLKFGNTRIDVGMGMQQYAVALARTYSGETKNLKTGKLKPTTPGDVVGSLARSKTTPALGAAMDVWDIGHDKNPPPGHGQTYLQVGANLWLPITSRNVVDIMEEHGVAAGTAFEILDLLGVSIQHFDTSKTLPKRVKTP